jgi:hypothetical protein
MKTVTEKIRELLISNREALLWADVLAQEIQNGICFDGIVDEVVFYEQSQKVIFLLKETNGNNSNGKAPESYKDWDYIGWLEHQQANDEPGNEENSRAFYKTFYNVCMWLDIYYDILDGNHILYEDYIASGRFDTKTMRKNLSKTGIVNLKKTWGGASTDWKALNHYLQNETVLEVLRKQIAYIAPDVVLCGGQQVFDFAKKIFGGEVQTLLLADGSKTSYFRVNSTTFLNFYHPSCRKKREDLYNVSAEVFSMLKQLL